MLQAPEIQTMYSLNMPVSAIRTKIRQEFERHRYVSQLKTTDVLLFNSHQEFQVRHLVDKRSVAAAVEDIRTMNGDWVEDDKLTMNRRRH